MNLHDRDILMIGRKEKAFEIAQTALSMGLSEEQIIKLTNLSPDEISDLKKELSKESAVTAK